MGTASKLIILERDGVINRGGHQFIKNPNGWKPMPGSLEAIARLVQADYRIVVATNQSAIGRSMLDMQTLNAIHGKMYKMVAEAAGRIDAIFYCPHTMEMGCSCRKPETGMLESISMRFKINLKGVPIVGDALPDLESAASMGAQPVLVLTGKGEKTLSKGGLPEGTLVYHDLAAFVSTLI